MTTVQNALLVCCFGATVASGVLRGVLDHRWGPNEHMVKAAERLQSLPKTIGPWSCSGFRSLDPETAKMLACTGQLVADYTHQQSGETVSVILMIGPAGPLAVHTPDVCYASTNYMQRGERRLREIGESAFWVIDFEENAAGNRPLEVVYGWKQDAAWVAPLNSRTAFAGVPALYKIQIASHTTGIRQETTAGQQFLAAAIDVINTTCQLPIAGEAL